MTEVEKWNVRGALRYIKKADEPDFPGLALAIQDAGGELDNKAVKERLM